MKTIVLQMPTLRTVPSYIFTSPGLSKHDPKITKNETYPMH